MKTIFYPVAKGFLFYHEFTGKKPTHVYLSGLGPGASGVYPSLIHQSELAAYHSIIPDFLGFGYSDRPEDFGYTIDEHADTVAYLLDHFQEKECTVIGTSMGGTIAITLATKRPDLVGKLVVAEPVLEGFDPFEVTQYSEEQYVTSEYNTFLEQFQQMILRSSYPQDLGLWLMFKRAAPHAFYRSAVSMSQSPNPTWGEQFFQLKIPRLYIWSEDNYREEKAELLIKQGVQVAVIPKSGHPMMNHNPSAFVRTISDFILQLPLNKKT